MYLTSIYKSPAIEARIELRLTPEEAELVDVALELLSDDLVTMSVYHCDTDIQRGVHIIGALLERLDRALGHQEGGAQ